ncbi:dual specificity protein phosphatase family protein [Budvicia diplopodorum]|uniref:dual specificity protein phosphatase family protein n=1 Tax=Budvicia diplopodorum TaxID=1119056 RepID=UPI00135CE037|nr:dual specificity protein phosphatase family protein [Budvicia diplopodorum]
MRLLPQFLPRMAIFFILFTCGYAMATSETGVIQAAKQVSNSSVDNFYQVSDELYRSGQPGAPQMKELEQRGVKSILNLRNFHTDNNEAKGTQLKLYHVPMEAGRLTEPQLISALRVMKYAPKPMVVHCWHGSDRTGLMVAMYRMVYQGWPKDAALAELKQPEFGYHQWAYYNIVQYIDRVDIDSIRAQINHPDDSHSVK